MNLSLSTKQAGSGGNVAVFHYGGTDFLIPLGQPNESDGGVQSLLCPVKGEYFVYA